MKNMFCLLLSLLIIGSSQAKPNPSDTTGFRHIPADANQVIRVNLGSIGSKIDWLSLFSLFKKHGINEVDPWNNKPYMDYTLIFNAGINFRQDIVVAMTNAIDLDSIEYTTVLIHLTDSGKLAAFLHKIDKKFRFLHGQGRQRVATDSSVTCAFNDHLAVIVFARSIKPGRHIPAFSAQNLSTFARRSLAALNGFPTSYFTTDAVFNAQFSAAADIEEWNRGEASNGLFKKLLSSKLPMSQLDAFTQMSANASHSPTFTSVRFESGKIIYHRLKTCSVAEKTNLLRIAGQPLENNLIPQIPEGELLGVAAIHLNIPALMDSVDKMATSNPLMPMLKAKDLSSADVLHALKGEFLFLLFNPDKNAPAGKGPFKTPVLYLESSVDDPTTFTKLAAKLGLVDAALASADTTNSADTTHHGPFRYYTVQNGLVVISATRQQTLAWFSHPSTAPNPIARLLTDQAQKSPFSVSIDMQSAADFLTSAMTKGDTLAAKDKAVVSAIRQMDAVLISSGGVEENGLSSYAELRFTIPNKNGLATLLEIVGSFARAGQDHQ